MNEGSQTTVSPKWLEDISTTLGVHSQYVAWGNVRDLHLIDDGQGPRPVDTMEALHRSFRAAGIDIVLIHDPLTGVSALGDQGIRERAAEVTGLALNIGPVAVTLPRLGQLVQQLSSDSAHHIALLVPFASRLAVDPAHLSLEEHEFFVAMERLSRSATPNTANGTPPMHNPVVWVLSREQDFPHWLTADNDHIRTVVVPEPDLAQRSAMADFTLSVVGLSGDESQLGEAATRVAGATEGMSLRAVRDCIRLGGSMGLELDELDEAVRCYRVGVADNPWRDDYLRERIDAGESSVPERVLGQTQAVTAAFDVLKRSVMGMSGAHTSSQGGRPRGILFFAGPTGVGKTELAKAITNLVFGDDSAYLRFDMSEYSAEQSEARFVGAPPGYVGYDAGGQLTNGVREKPFSLLLFDEIEKANSRILDKFLQILDDGRLTDGRGGTVHFTETLIVFTSNLGIYEEDEHGVRHQLVDESMPYDEMADRVRGAVQDHFTRKIGRPELLNRLGDNIIVFAFISEVVGRQIFDLQMRNVAERVRTEHETELVVDPAVMDAVRTYCIADRSLGGRGIGNRVEVAFVNPLARAMFQRVAVEGPVTVTGWSMVDGIAEVTLG